MHGIMLKQLGHNVRILERSLTSARASHAAGVGTGAKGHEFFNTYDSTSQPHAFHCPGYQSLDSNSKVKRTLNAPLWVTSWDVVYYRLRALFDGLPSIFCPATPPVSEGSGRARHELGKQVTDVLEDDELLAVTFEDLSKQGQTGTLQAHLVLDASGSYSVARQKMMPDLRRPYAGFVAWRGTVPEGAVSEATQKLFETRFNVFSMSDGYVVGYVYPPVIPCYMLTHASNDANQICCPRRKRRDGERATTIELRVVPAHSRRLMEAQARHDRYIGTHSSQHTSVR